MPRKCVNYPNNFCYVCGDLTFKDQRRSLAPLIRQCYELYFGCKVGDQELGPSYLLFDLCETSGRLG